MIMFKNLSDTIGKTVMNIMSNKKQNQQSITSLNMKYNLNKAL